MTVPFDCSSGGVGDRNDRSRCLWIVPILADRQLRGHAEGSPDVSRLLLPVQL